MEIIFAKKTVRNTEICKKQAQKQANFNQNKHKNKQLASLKKNRKSIEKQAQIRGKTARLATLAWHQSQRTTVIVAQSLTANNSVSKKCCVLDICGKTLRENVCQ